MKYHVLYSECEFCPVHVHTFKLKTIIFDQYEVFKKKYYKKKKFKKKYLKRSIVKRKVKKIQAK